MKLCRPAYFVRTTQLLPSPWPQVMAGFVYYVIQLNDTTNDSIFHMPGGMQGVIPRSYVLFVFYSWVVE